MASPEPNAAASSSPLRVSASAGHARSRSPHVHGRAQSSTGITWEHEREEEVFARHVSRLHRWHEEAERHAEFEFRLRLAGFDKWSIPVRRAQSWHVGASWGTDTFEELLAAEADEGSRDCAPLRIDGLSAWNSS